MKKILFIISKISGGGSENVLNIVSNELCQKYKLYILVLNDYNKRNSFSKKKKIKYIFLKNSNLHLHKNFTSKLKKIFEIRKWYKDLNPDVIFSFILETNIFSILASFFSKHSVIISERNDSRLEKKKRKWKFLSFFIYFFSCKITTNSISNLEYLKKFFFYKEPIYLANPVKKICKKNFKKQKVITFIGKLEYQKAVDVIIHGFKKSNLHKENWKLQIVGNGKLSGLLKQLCKKEEIENNVIFKNFSDNLEKIYNSSNLLVLASRYEGTPNVVLEAVSLELPILVSSNCNEIIRLFNENIFKFKTDDIDDLSNVLKRIILMEKKIIDKMCKKNLKVLKKEFNLSKIISNWERVLLN